MAKSAEDEEPAIKKFSVLADSWWKIITILAAIIFGIYQLSAVWLTIQDTERKLNIFIEENVKENAIRDDRSDKRYQRATEMYNELKGDYLKLEAELEKHLIEDAYHRGYVDAKIEKGN